MTLEYVTTTDLLLAATAVLAVGYCVYLHRRMARMCEEHNHLISSVFLVTRGDLEATARFDDAGTMELEFIPAPGKYPYKGENK